MRDEETPPAVRELQTSFLSLISHELRAPLQTINGYLDRALSGMVGALNPKQSQFLKRARSGGIQLTAVVDDLLFLARAEGGLFRPASRPTAFAQLVEDALEEVSLLAEEAQIATTITLPRSLPPVPGAAQRLGQTVRNLLMEAIARAPEGGDIRIGAETPTGALVLCITIEAQQPHPANSDGATDHARDALRHGGWLDEPITAQRLRVCRLIAEAHGGALTIASARHAGPAFTLRLPLAPNQQTA